MKTKHILLLALCMFSFFQDYAQGLWLPSNYATQSSPNGFVPHFWDEMELRVGQSESGVNNVGILKFSVFNSSFHGGNAGTNEMGLFTWNDARPIRIGGNLVKFMTEGGNANNVYMTGKLGIGESQPGSQLSMKPLSGLSYNYALEIKDDNNDSKIQMNHNGLLHLNGTSSNNILELARENGDEILTVEESGTVRFPELANNNHQALFLDSDGNLYAQNASSPNPDSIWLPIGNNFSSASSKLFGTWSNTDIEGMVGGNIVSTLYAADGNYEFENSTTFGRMNVPYSNDFGMRVHATKENYESGYYDHRIFSCFDDNINTSLYPYGKEVFSVLPNSTNIATNETVIGDIGYFYGSIKEMYIDAEVTPLTTNTHDFGNSSYRWKEIFSVNPLNTASDRRMKKNIQDMNYGLSTLLKLRPVTYEWKEHDNGTRLGFIAQELEEVIPEIVTQDEKGNYGVRYAELIPVLTKCIKEQQTQIEQLTQKVEKLANNNTPSQTNVNIQKETLNQQPILFQNNPNPFSSTTHFDYYVPQSAKSAFIKVVDQQGRLVKSFTIYQLGYGQVSMDCSDLMVGQYLYSLVVNEHIADTKKMAIAR